MPSRKPASRRSRKSTVGRITPPLDVRSEDSISSLMKLVKKGPITIVLVYADWCGHCHTYKPKFDEAAKNRKSPFQVASINETMLNSVNKRIKSINNSANINVSGYPSVVSLNNKGEFVKDLSQEAAIKMLNTPMPNAMPNAPKNVMENAPKNVMPNAPKNVMPNAPKNVMPNAPKNVMPNAPKNVMENTVQENMPIAQKKPNVKLPQAYVSEPLLRIGGESYVSPVAPKYLGGSLYKSLSLSPYQMGNPSTLFKSLSRTKTQKRSKTRKSKSRK
jgi:thiol-disulfide isomerase/thioredoxin